MKNLIKGFKPRRAAASPDLVYSVAFMVIIIVILIALLLVRAEAGDTQSQAQTIPNVPPTVDSFAVGTVDNVENNNITLTENTDTTVRLEGTFSDLNSCQDATNPANWVVLAYGPGFTSACTPTENNCYKGIQSTLAFTNCDNADDITADFDSTQLFKYFAIPGVWTGSVTAGDGDATSSEATDTFTIATNNALNAITASVNYGSISINSLTPNKIITLKNTGNVAQDYSAVATDFTCTNGVTAPVGIVHMSTSAIGDQTAYDAASALDGSTPVTLDASTVVATTIAAPSTKTINVAAKPTIGEGTCSGSTITFTATTDI